MSLYQWPPVHCVTISEPPLCWMSLWVEGLCSQTNLCASLHHLSASPGARLVFRLGRSAYYSSMLPVIITWTSPLQLCQKTIPASPPPLQALVCKATPLLGVMRWHVFKSGEKSWICSALRGRRENSTVLEMPCLWDVKVTSGWNNTAVTSWGRGLSVARLTLPVTDNHTPARHGAGGSCC